ncbi:MAG: DUF523 domain-containing protein [Ruminococcaceae bacterium]|nr:DUF523 domain-containing protein [Oscillospiraceae bacterium]
MKILVSACLLGEPCRYDGQSKPCEAVLKLQRDHTLIPVCPEVMGGLSTPRPPAELQSDRRVVNRLGRDVTANYRAGAEDALRIAQAEGCSLAILKEKSPSCGKGKIYDGSFTGTLCQGNGVCAALLLANGIRVLGETEVREGAIG